MFDNTFIARVAWKLACLLLLPACCAWGTWKAVVRPAAPEAPRLHEELPPSWEGRPLRPLALSAVETRFARSFPGTIARATDGERVLVLRTVQRPTRMLHPAADCYRGLGWTVEAEALELRSGDALWRCFDALQEGRRLRVCERIEDAAGRGFTDASAWYWAALLGHSSGPWRAVTVATP